MGDQDQTKLKQAIDILSFMCSGSGVYLVPAVEVAVLVLVVAVAAGAPIVPVLVRLCIKVAIGVAESII